MSPWLGKIKPLNAELTAVTVDRQVTTALRQQGRTTTAGPYNEFEDAEPQLDATALGRVEVIKLFDTSLHKKLDKMRKCEIQHRAV